MWCKACFPIRVFVSIPTLASGDWMSSPIDWFLILRCHKPFISEWPQGGDHQRLKSHHQQHISSINTRNIFLKTWNESKSSQTSSQVQMHGKCSWFFLIIGSASCMLCKDLGSQVNNVRGGSIWWQPKSQVKTRKLWKNFLFHSQICSNQDDSGVISGEQKKNVQITRSTRHSWNSVNCCEERKNENCDLH